MALLFIVGLTLLGFAAALTLRAAAVPLLRIAARTAADRDLRLRSRDGRGAATGSKPLACIAEQVGRSSALHVRS